MNNDQPTTPLPSRKLSWLTVVLGILTLVTFFAVSGPSARYITPMMGGVSYGNKAGSVPEAYPTSVSGGGPETSVTLINAMGSGAPSVYRPSPPYPTPDVPVTDTREFLKTYYNASLRTRDVPALTQRAETIVRGHGGRIDQESSSPQYGSISFAVPQSKFDAFRAELESLVGSRFLTVNISSQNLLPQKQSIEEQQEQADSTLADYKAARQKLVSSHANIVSVLQTRIDADAKQLAILRAQPSTSEVAAQIQSVTDDWTSLKQQLANENASYAAQLKKADANITYAQDWQKAVQTQDQTLLDNVATVTGTISLQWISLWDIALLYLPGYWIPAIFAALTVLSFLRDRRHSTLLAS